MNNKQKFFRDLTNYETAILVCYKILGHNITYKKIKEITGMSQSTICNTILMLKQKGYNFGGIFNEVSDSTKN